MPDKRRKVQRCLPGEGLTPGSREPPTQAALRQLDSSPNLLYRWQQAQLVTEPGSEEVARGPKVRALRAHHKQAKQELDRSKKLWSAKASTDLSPSRARRA